MSVFPAGMKCFTFFEIVFCNFMTPGDMIVVSEIVDFCSSSDDPICSSPIVDFTNILRASFARVDSKSTERLWLLDNLIALFGSACTRADCKHVGKINPRRQSYEINIVKKKD